MEGKGEDKIDVGTWNLRIWSIYQWHKLKLEYMLQKGMNIIEKAQSQKKSNK